jgi:hypothetical protein
MQYEIGSQITVQLRYEGQVFVTVVSEVDSFGEFVVSFQGSSYQVHVSQIV